MKLIWRFIRPHWKLFALTVLLLVVDVAGSLLIPTLAAQMLNLGISGHSFQNLIETGLWMAAASIVSGICAILADMLVPRFPQEWDKTCEWLSMINH